VLEPLLLDLLEWIAREPRSHADVMDAWRTSCPRLPVWEEATDRGFVRRAAAGSLGAQIVLTDAGRRFLQKNGRVRQHSERGHQAGEPRDRV
jgi:hypothetical protein